jgi:hypothetical protein
MDLEEPAGPVMLPWIFHHHATGRNPAISFLKRRHVPRDLRMQRFLGGHALKIDLQRGFHLWLLDLCHSQLEVASTNPGTVAANPPGL